MDPLKDRFFRGAFLNGLSDELHRWAKSDNEHVRRLASEGCRPRLPWATTLGFLMDDIIFG